MAHKIEIGRKAFEELRDEVFKDFPPEVRNRIGLGCHKDRRLVSCNIVCAGVYAEAGKYLGINKSVVGHSLVKGHLAGGYHWKYA